MEQDKGVSADADRATHEPNPQAVSALRVGIADAWRAESFNLKPDEWADVYSEVGPIVCFDASEMVTDVVACVFGATPEARDERATLIAAAPALLAALEAAVANSDALEAAGHYRRRDTPLWSIYQQAVAAILKARGEQP